MTTMTKNDSRIVLLLALVLLVPLPFALALFGGLGEVEMLIWLAAVVTWVMAFVLWGRRRRSA